MAKKKRPHESEDKDEADDTASLDAIVPTPMDKFRSLARRLTNVSKADLLKEQQRYEAAKRKRKQ